MLKSPVFKLIYDGFKRHGMHYMLFPLPVLSGILISMILGAAVASIVYMPFVFSVPATLIAIVLLYGIFFDYKPHDL